MIKSNSRVFREGVEVDETEDDSWQNLQQSLQGSVIKSDSRMTKMIEVGAYEADETEVDSEHFQNSLQNALLLWSTVILWSQRRTKKEFMKMMKLK